MNEYDITLIVVLVLAFTTLYVMFRKPQPTERIHLTVSQQRQLDRERLDKLTLASLYRSTEPFMILSNDMNH